MNNTYTCKKTLKTYDLKLVQIPTKNPIFQGK